MKLRLAVAALLFLSKPALADFSGAAIDFNRTSIQFLVPEGDDGSAVRDIVFGNGKVLQRLAAAISRNRESLRGREVTLSLDVARKDGNFEALVLSSSGVTLNKRDDTLAFNSADELLSALCEGLQLEGCAAPSDDARALTPQAGDQAPSPDPQNKVVVTVGAFPAGSGETQLLVAPPGADLAPEPGYQSRGLNESIDGLVERSFGKILNDGQEAPPLLPSAPKFFVVHCTAFSADDALIKKWVRNRISEGKRNLSHGVIAPTGEWLPMWKFSERKVWATKTERCPETRKALGQAVNIEVHYHCGERRADAPTEAQYKTLAKLYKELQSSYGYLAIVSHREVDRGLYDGHGDPYKFSFEKFYTHLADNGLDLSKIKRISDARHMLPTYREISHHWEPLLSGPLVMQNVRPDDCKQYP